jgi:hypothetical protein
MDTHAFPSLPSLPENRHMLTAFIAFLLAAVAASTNAAAQSCPADPLSIQILGSAALPVFLSRLFVSRAGAFQVLGTALGGPVVPGVGVPGVGGGVRRSTLLPWSSGGLPRVQAPVD